MTLALQFATSNTETVPLSMFVAYSVRVRGSTAVAIGKPPVESVAIGPSQPRVRSALQRAPSMTEIVFAKTLAT